MKRKIYHQVKVMRRKTNMGLGKKISKEVKNGKRYILFPEGGYHFNNKNKMYENR